MNEPIDVRALRLSEHRRGVIVASVMLQNGHELTRRARASSPILFLGTWARPALAAAAVLAAVCGTMLASSTDRAGLDNGLTPGGGIAEALGVSRTTTSYLAANSTPTLSELLAVEEEVQ